MLKGGQYDYLMQRFAPGAKAIGFAMYLDELSVWPHRCRQYSSRAVKRPG